MISNVSSHRYKFIMIRTFDGLWTHKLMHSKFDSHNFVHHLCLSPLYIYHFHSKWTVVDAYFTFLTYLLGLLLRFTAE